MTNLAATLNQETASEGEALAIVQSRVTEDWLAVWIGLFVFALKFLERSHQGFGDVASAVDAEASDGLRELLLAGDDCGCHTAVPNLGG